MTIRILFACFIFSFLSCSKEDVENPTKIEMETEPSIFEAFEIHYGISIPDKEELEHVAIFPAPPLLTHTVLKDDVPLARVYDLTSKKLISSFKFDSKPVKANLGYGQSTDITFKSLQITHRTATHLYGVAHYDPPGIGYTMFVSDIKNSKIIEHNPKDGIISSPSNKLRTREWFDGSLLFTNDKSYKVIGPGQKTIMEGEHRSEILRIEGIAVSQHQAIVFDESVNLSSKSGFKIYSLETNSSRSIIYDPRNKANDRVEVKSVTSDGKVATVNFKITAYSGDVSEELVKVDLKALKIVE